jgi:regulator of sirC expression with transglutaminase-like and TPR domain
MQQKMKAVCNENPKGNYSNYKVIAEVKELLSKMTDEQKEFLGDPDLVKKFDELYLNALADHRYFSQAKDAEAKTREVVSKITIGKAEHLEDLLKVRENILKLPQNAKKYLDRGDCYIKKHFKSIFGKRFFMD